MFILIINVHTSLPMSYPIRSLFNLNRRDIGEEVTALAWDGDQAIVGGGRGSIQVNKSSLQKKK